MSVLLDDMLLIWQLPSSRFSASVESAAHCTVRSGGTVNGVPLHWLKCFRFRCSIAASI